MTSRNDAVWQDATVAANYHVSRNAIPFVDTHFEVMHRLIDVAGIEVRNVLDLGAGDGLAAAQVMRKQPVQRATLTDFSQPMLDPARKRFSASELDIAFVEGDFRESDWHPAVTERGPYDLVISRFAIHHIPDEMKRSLYGAVLNWLRPGGMLVQIEHVASGSPMYNTAHDRLMVERLMDSRGEVEGFEEVFASYRLRADGPANILAPICDQLSWLRDIGFSDVDCAFKCFELSVFAGRRPAQDEG